MNWIDTHAHAYAKNFEQDYSSYIKNALENNVDKIILPCIDEKSVAPMFSLQKQFPKHFFPCIGLHPCAVKANFKEVLETLEINLTQKNTKIYAIGEIGLDFYHDQTFKAEQYEALKIQLDWAKMYNLPVIFHIREAFDEIFSFLDKEMDKNLKGVFHCFSGDLNQIKKIKSYKNFKFGIGGIITYKNALIRESIQHISLEDMLIETDAPYLAPTPYRGKQNESAYIPLIAKEIATILQVSEEKLAEITSKNAKDLFSL